jgi:hypothetical protein
MCGFPRRATHGFPITQRMVLSNARGALNVRDARLAILLRGFGI